MVKNKKVQRLPPIPLSFSAKLFVMWEKLPEVDRNKFKETESCLRSRCISIINAANSCDNELLTGPESLLRLNSDGRHRYMKMYSEMINELEDCSPWNEKWSDDLYEFNQIFYFELMQKIFKAIEKINQAVELGALKDMQESRDQRLKKKVENEEIKKEECPGCSQTAEIAVYHDPPLCPKD